jgi:hypothetical protein
MRWLVLVVLVACGRPDIDPAPFGEACSRANDTCPPPYVCAVSCGFCPDAAVEHCLVPCVHDDDCAAGFYCEGDSQDDTERPNGYCFTT